MLVSLGLIIALTSCATVTERWGPFPNVEELESFDSRWESAPKTPSNQITQLQRELVKYRDEIFKRALERSKLEYESTGVTTYGGLAAVAGALADQTGLMNTGAGLAALGLTNSSRYRFSEQTQIYRVALTKLACITGKVNSTDDITVAQASYSRDPAAQDAAKNFTAKVVTAVDAVRVEYTNSLLGLTPNALSQDELRALITKYRPAGLAVSAEDEDQQVYDAAGVLVLNLVMAIQTCAK